MKKIITSVFTLTLIGLMFTSCRHYSDLSIAKRHYRSGYYVEYNSGKKADPTTQQAKANPEKSKSEVKTSIPATTNPNSTSDNQVNLNDKASSSSFTLAKKLRHAQALITTPDIHSIQPEQNKSIPESKILPLENKKIFLQEARHHGEGGGGHSLLWWIIVLLIVICLLDLLAGGFLGGLLYLLLVIAVVLLILRLLEMI
jgi:hypothetical protein